MSDTSTPTSVGAAWVRAIVDRDTEALKGMLADEVSFKGLTPGRLWEAETPDQVAGVVFDNWFEEADRIETSSTEEGDDVEDVRRMGYRFEITNGDGPHVVEQQAYYRTTDGRIDYLRVVCSGFRPRT